MAYLGLLLAVLADNALRLLASPGTAWTPDLPLILALYVGFRARDSRDLGLAVVLGLFSDCFSVAPLGHFAFLFGADAYLAMRLRRYVPPDALASHVVASLFCALGHLFLGLVLAVVTVHGDLGGGFLRAGSGAMVSALVAPFLFGLFDRSRFFRRALGGRHASYRFA